MIQSLFLPNDCNDGSERLQPTAWSGLLVQSLRGRRFFFLLDLYGPIGNEEQSSG